MLNQYTQRTVPGYVDVLGSASTGATVTVNYQSATRQTQESGRGESIVRQTNRFLPSTLSTARAQPTGSPCPRTSTPAPPRNETEGCHLSRVGNRSAVARCLLCDWSTEETFVER